MVDCIIDCSSLESWEQDTWLDCYAPSKSPSPSDDPALKAAYQLQHHQQKMCEMLAKHYSTFEFVKSHKLRHKVAILPQPDVLVGPNAQPLIPVVVLDSVLAQELIAQKKLDKRAQLKLGNDAKEIVYNKQSRRLTYDLRSSTTDTLTPIRRLLQHNARRCKPSDWQRLHLPPGAHTLDSSPWYASYLTPTSLEELQAIINAPDHTNTAASPSPVPAALASPAGSAAPATPPLLDGFTDEELQKVLPLLLPLADMILKWAQAISADQTGSFEGRDTLEGWRDAAEKLLRGRDVEPWPLFPVGTCSGPQYDEASQAAGRYLRAAKRALLEIVEAARARAYAALRKLQAAQDKWDAAVNAVEVQTAAWKQAIARKDSAIDAALKDRSTRMQKAAAAATAVVTAQMVNVDEALEAMRIANHALTIADDKLTLRERAAEQKSTAINKLLDAMQAALSLPTPAAWAAVPVAAASRLSDADLALPPPEPMWGSIMSPRRHLLQVFQQR